jgi:hypothetical protein
MLGGQFSLAHGDQFVWYLHYKLNVKRESVFQLAAFIKNRVYRFAPNFIQNIVDGFRQMNGEKIKTGLKSFQATIR